MDVSVSRNESFFLFPPVSPSTPVRIPKASHLPTPCVPAWPFQPPLPSALWNAQYTCESTTPQVEGKPETGHSLMLLKKKGLK